MRFVPLIVVLSVVGLLSACGGGGGSAGTPDPLKVGPASLEIAELDLQPVALTITGGTPPYRVFSSDVVFFQARLATGNSVAVDIGTGGNRCVDADRTATITVLDGDGVSAASTLTVKDGTSPCPAP